MKPLIRRSELTGRIYLITSYKVDPDGLIIASKKTDVTEQVEALIEQAADAQR